MYKNWAYRVWFSVSHLRRSSKLVHSHLHAPGTYAWFLVQSCVKHIINLYNHFQLLEQVVAYSLLNFALAFASRVLLDWNNLLAGKFHFTSTRILSFDHLFGRIKNDLDESS